MNGIKILMWGWHCHSQSVPVILTSMFILFHRRWWWHWMSSPSSGADVEHCTRCDDIKLPGPWRGFPTILSSCWRPLSSMYLALATLISILRPHGFHYWVMRVSGILQHAGRYPTFLCTQMSWTEAGQPAKYSKICVTDFLKLDRLEDFPVALPVILSVQILRCLDADLVSIQRGGWRLGCWKQDAREHGKLFLSRTDRMVT